eukprot:COSAG01_NODE_1653_length_9619_cov_43.055573_8_plen_144_part_00
MCTTPLQLAGRLAGSWLAGRAWLAAYFQHKTVSVPCTVVRYSELYRYCFTRHLGKIRSRYGAAVGQSAVPLYVNCDSHAVPSLGSSLESIIARLDGCMHLAKAEEPWTGDRLEKTEFHEIAEICKTGIRQLLGSPYDSGRKSC